MQMIVHGLAGRVRRRPKRTARPGRAARPGCSHEQLEALDVELWRRAREAGRLRFEMGIGLDLLERCEGHHALGFSSLEAYGLERCERSASWVQKARGLARRLEQLPVLREALISGAISWSMAAVLATVAVPEDAHFWLAEAAQRTVREMRALVLEHKASSASAGAHLEVEEEPLRTLTVTVSREDAWCFERARLLGRHLGERTDAELMFGLVAESTSTLCGELPRSAGSLADDKSPNAQRAWEQELARMRTEAERRCEANFRRERVVNAAELRRLVWADSPEAIDEQLRRLAHELVVREVAYGRALEAFFVADGWRRLGYATASQYARERLGSSLSSIKDKRRLARRLGQLRFLASAVEGGELGYEAARLVTGVATLATVEAWVERAKERTLRHLREDIDAAELTARWCEGSDAMLPPSDAEVQRVAELERAVIAGQIPPPPIGASQGGRVTLRVRVRVRVACDFRHWEALYLRHAHHRGSFLRFACDLFTEVWCPRAPEVAFGHIYARDLHRCQSPCCGRRDVTPHHLRFRSLGGDDADGNLISLCTWCHLAGIHRGQMSASPPASAMRWTFGRNPHTVVEGRRRIRAR